ncbi:Hypothetical predicted protein [Mytilus galloprovincialis]|uniref:Uncharacterized protein n=1 Tax=Mytilus galloprovincialis TaxID=29158 RepID=A0A8B6DTW0_MYTGA|nr:Hypothetical predicted protein [Mytilus galloprovincialis]
MVNFLPDEDSVYNWTDGVKRFYEVESSRESSLLSPEKKKSPSKKGVKRRLITEDKENDQKMKR